MRKKSGLVVAGAMMALAQAAAGQVYEANLELDHRAIRYWDVPLADPVTKLAALLARGEESCRASNARSFASPVITMRRNSGSLASMSAPYTIGSTHGFSRRWRRATGHAASAEILRATKANLPAL